MFMKERGIEEKENAVKMSLFDIAKELALLIDEVDVDESDEKFERIQKAMSTY